jgi:hypothetical protein
LFDQLSIKKTWPIEKKVAKLARGQNQKKNSKLLQGNCGEKPKKNATITFANGESFG